MDYIQINPDNVAPSAPRPRIRKVAAYLLYRQLISGGGGIVTDDLVLRSNFNDMANLSLTFPSNGSAEFNGTSDYIQLNDPFSHTNHTIAAWIYVEPSASDKFIFDARDIGTDGIILYSRADEYLKYEVNSSALTSSAIYTNEWVYLVGTYDGTTQKMYINGSVDSSASASTTISNTINARIGARSHTGLAYYMDGNLANVAIWNRALTSDEINTAMWASYDQLPTSIKVGLQAWYALDNITGTDVPDSTGNYNGTAY